MNNALNQKVKLRTTGATGAIFTRVHAYALRVCGCACAYVEKSSRSSRLRSIDVGNAYGSKLSCTGAICKPQNKSSRKAPARLPTQRGGQFARDVRDARVCAINVMGNLPTTLRSIGTRGEFPHALKGRGVDARDRASRDRSPRPLRVPPGSKSMRAPKARENASRGLSKIRLTRLTDQPSPVDTRAANRCRTSVPACRAVDGSGSNSKKIVVVARRRLSCGAGRAAALASRSISQGSHEHA